MHHMETRGTVAESPPQAGAALKDGDGTRCAQMAQGGRESHTGTLLDEQVSGVHCVLRVSCTLGPGWARRPAQTPGVQDSCSPWGP